MGKLLRVLVVIFLILSIGALALGIMLFGQREQLKGRTQKLERTLIALGPTLEAEEPAAATSPEYPARDIDETTAELLDTPEKSDFWETYQNKLETTDLVTLDVAREQDQLKAYYLPDPLRPGKPYRDETTGLKVTEGEGTMQEVLDNILAKSEAQLNRLNETRHQLRKIREEFVDTITELNTKKSDLRQALSTIVDRDSSIMKLEDQISTLQGTIEEKEDQIRMLNDTIEEQKTTIAERDEQIVDLDSEINVLKDEIERLRGRLGPATVTRVLQHLTRGQKGTVTSVSADWNFCVLKFTPEFMDQIAAELDKGKGTPEIDLLIKRPSADGDEIFVTKVKLNHIRQRENVGVADILTNWQQVPVQVGDGVYY